MSTKNEAFGITDPHTLALDKGPARLVVEGPLSYQAIAAIQGIVDREQRKTTERDEATAEVEHLRGVVAAVEVLLVEWERCLMFHITEPLRAALAGATE